MATYDDSEETEELGLGKPLGAEGTVLAEYVKANKNRPPRQCDHCVWYSDDKCHHPVVMIDPEVEGKAGEPKPVGDEDCCKFFRSRKAVLMYLVRHGDTALNDEGAFRGWMDVELNDNGRKQAKKVGKFLKDKGIVAILCSPLQRAVETAQIIAKEIGYDPENICPLHGFLPWHVGELSGESKEANKNVLKYALDNPQWPLPGGESVEEFGARFREAFEWILHEATEEDGPVLVVFHTSNIIQSQHHINGESVAARPEEADSVDPGGAIEVRVEYDKGSEEGKIVAEPVFGIVGDGKYGS